MGQRDGENKGDKDSDVLKHMAVLLSLKSHGPTNSEIDIFGTLQSLRSQFEGPRNHERDRKTNDDREHD